MKILNLECKPDERLAKVLGIPSKNIEHHNDKGRIGNLLKEDVYVIAMVDEDPGKPSSKSFATLEKESEAHGIKVLVHKKKKQYVVVLCPELEGWIINISKKSKISLSEFGLPEKAKQLHKEINYRLPAFEKLLLKLLEKKNPTLLYLQALLKSSLR